MIIHLTVSKKKLGERGGGGGGGKFNNYTVIRVNVGSLVLKLNSKLLSINDKLIL